MTRQMGWPERRNQAEIASSLSATDAGALALISDADAVDATVALATANLTDAVVLIAVSDTDAYSPDTLTGFNASPLASGGDVIDLSVIANLADSVATGLTLVSDFGADNVFIFDDTAVTIDAAASAIATDVSVVANQGYIVVRDSGNTGATTVYHSTDLSQNGAETALVILSGVTITDLVAANFLV